MEKPVGFIEVRGIYFDIPQKAQEDPKLRSLDTKEDGLLDAEDACDESCRASAYVNAVAPKHIKSAGLFADMVEAYRYISIAHAAAFCYVPPEAREYNPFKEGTFDLAKPPSQNACCYPPDLGTIAMADAAVRSLAKAHDWTYESGWLALAGAKLSANLSAQVWGSHLYPMYAIPQSQLNDLTTPLFARMAKDWNRVVTLTSNFNTNYRYCVPGLDLIYAWISDTSGEGAKKAKESAAEADGGPSRLVLPLLQTEPLGGYRGEMQAER